MLLPIFLLIFVIVAGAQTHECNKRWYDQDSFVCVCNYTVCDEPEQLGDFSDDKAIIYSTSKSSDRLKRTEHAFKSSSAGRTLLVVDPTTRYQRIFGFGGAVTDSVADIWKTYNPLLPKQYFGKSGIGYGIVRVPIASCDFSKSGYSYLEDDQDFELKSISFNDGIKVFIELNCLKQYFVFANETSYKAPKFIASPWSAPGWMKENGQMKGGAALRGSFNGIYYLTYARYLQKFFIHYYSEGIKFFGMTIQNEPSTGQDPNYNFQTIDFAKVRLRPIFNTHPATKDLALIGHDDDRTYVFDAAKKTELAIHWYSNKDDHSVLSAVHRLFPDRFILATEANIPLLGSWNYAQRYAHDIIQDLNNFVVGWTDWNLVGNFLDSPIIVNQTLKSYPYAEYSDFYKQPMFYALAHFSMFVVPDSVRIKSTDTKYLPDELDSVAFKTPDGNLVLVVLNKDDQKTFELAIGEEQVTNQFIHLTLEPKSIKTVIWKRKSQINRTQKLKSDF
ncbi:O-Glycosyl hydrolase family 30 [Aphelenchoides bicaudatus]|nr:O-Glycosyl hydrolase family 30 [Aphelenchoides bicaudatus]